MRVRTKLVAIPIIAVGIVAGAALLATPMATAASDFGGPADLDFHYGRDGDRPIVGDFNGDGTDTVGIRRGDRYFLRNSNTGGPADLDFHYGRDGDHPIVGDWDGNGIDGPGVRRGDRYFLRTPDAPTSSTMITDEDVWDRLAECESNGNWQANTGNGYYGGLQFLPETWWSVGGSGMPHEASREEQIYRGQILQERSGWGQWPSCSLQLGLR